MINPGDIEVRSVRPAKTRVVIPGTIITYTGDGGGASDAEDVDFTPAGNLSSTNVQDAIEELDTEKQPLDSDLTAIAALSPTNDDILQRKSGSWVNRTMAQLKTDLAIVVANISDFTSAVGALITAERTASATLTNKTLTSPTLTTPALGTPASGNLANCTFPTLNQSTSGSAATLTTSRTIGTLTGDVTSAGSGFNGSANNSNAATLATVNSNTGSFGSASSVATFTVNGKGLITAAGSTSIAVTASAVSDFSTAADARIAAASATGTGSLVRATSPTLVTPALGTPSAVTLTNGTGLPVSGIVITGTPNGSKFLRDDGTWSTPAGGGGGIASVVPGTNIDVDNTDPANPVVSVETLALADISDVTASAAEVNVLDGVTSSTAELNILDGVTATAAELNALDGITATVTELNYVDGVTSAIQTQLDGKASTGSVSTVQTNLDNHTGDTTDAHDASAISFVPDDLPVTSTDVQSALYEAFLDPYIFAHNGTTAAPGVSVHLTTELGRLTNAQSGTTYTVQDSDHGCRIQFTNAGSIAVTVPNTLRSDFYCDWEQFGAGVPTFTGSSCTVRARGGATKSAGQYAVGGLSRADSDEFLLYGDITT